MASKRKKNVSNEGPVKIVGINHGVCLHLFLLMDGWKKEQFTDVTFYCQSSSSQPSLQNKLRANRSVLAAASPFFAALLPDCELELDVCVSVDLGFEEMFCVLEYIYCGKLLCSAQNKEKILSILKEFEVFVPDHLQNNYVYRRDCDDTEVEIIIEEAVNAASLQLKDSKGTTITSNSTDICIYSQDEENNDLESSLSSVSGTILQIEEKLPEKVSNFVKIYCNKSKHQTSANNNSHPGNHTSDTMEESEIYTHHNELGYGSINDQSASLLSSCSAEQVSMSESVNKSRDMSINELTADEQLTLLQGTPDKDIVTLQLPSQFVSGSLSSLSSHLEFSLVKRSVAQPNSSVYPLHLYHSQTWCYGVYSLFEPDSFQLSPEMNPYTDPLTLGKIQPLVHDWTSFRQPTFLISRPKRVYGRRNVVFGGRHMSTKAVLKLADIKNMKAHKGKIHVTLNGQPLIQSALPLLFSGGDTPSSESNSQLVRIGSQTFGAINVTESDDDKIDLALAKHFLQEEVRIKQKLQMRLKMFSERIAQYKELAFAILKRTKELERRKPENDVVKLLPITKKNGPQTQCEQCGKMVLASRLSIHLKIHSGVKSHLCDLCGRAFLLKAYLNAHIRINHRGSERPKRFMCSSCGYTCDQKHKLEVHERVHTDERPFDCQYCNKKFREKGTLVRHIRTHTGEKPYACNICGTSYAARDTYVQHYRRKHEQQRSDSTAPRSRARHSSVVIYRCEFCQKGFYRILAYEKHRATHTGVAAAVRCTQGDCDFTYSDMTQLKDHMAVCHPGKTYTCAVCSKVFLTKQNLVNHQSKHDPTLGFHCSYCSMSLTTKASLVAHEKIHTRDKPYECSFCGMRFHSPYLIKIHLRKHQPSQPKRKRSRRQVEEVIEIQDVNDPTIKSTASVAYY